MELDHDAYAKQLADAEKEDRQAMQPIQEYQNEDDYQNFNFATVTKARKDYHEEQKKMDALLVQEEQNLPEGVDAKQHIEKLLSDVEQTGIRSSDLEEVNLRKSTINDAAKRQVLNASMDSSTLK